MPRKPLRRLFATLFAALILLVIVGVWVAGQFPSLTNGPKSSAEILESLFKTPASPATRPADHLLEHINQAAVELFIRACDLPADVEGRLLGLVRGERFEEVTVPFVLFFYELYGAPAQAAAGDFGDLAYAEAIEPEMVREGRPGLSRLVRRSLELRRCVSRGLRLFDALFLQAKPGAIERDLPPRERYEDAAYKGIQDLVHETANDFLTPTDDALNQDIEENEYAEILEGLLNDDERLGAFVE